MGASRKPHARRSASRQKPARAGQPSREGRPTPEAASRATGRHKLAGRILDILEKTHPEATCALHYRDAYQLVVATILSAQCTDRRVNEVTPAVFRRYPRVFDLARAAPAELEELIKPTGFFRAKTKSLIGCAKGLVDEFGGEVPRSLDALVKLPGIGRKTANVVLGHVYDIAEGIAVDTHVLRVANRLGLVRSGDPGKIEQQLMQLIPRERWTRTTDLLIFHGRKICDARRPNCGACPAFSLCRWEARQSFALAGASLGRARPAASPSGTRRSQRQPRRTMKKPLRPQRSTRMKED